MLVGEMRIYYITIALKGRFFKRTPCFFPLFLGKAAMR